MKVFFNFYIKSELIPLVLTYVYIFVHFNFTLPVT